MPERPVIGLSMNYTLLGSYEQFHIRNRYLDAIFDHGGLPLPLPCTPDRDLVRQYLAKIDALVIIGGLDYPSQMYNQAPHPRLDAMHERRAGSDIPLFEEALQTGMPILGICAGAQLINIALGGSLIQHLEPGEMHIKENYHPVQVLGGHWLPAIFGSDALTVNSNHHQALDPQRIGLGLRVVALAEDGVVEAVELDVPQMVLGLQWHPERITDLSHRAMVFEFLAKEALTYRNLK
ncbi:MAG TPA: gamma-glutamyl-gamma-aminobutyrate hydrolase family protein [Candidatus Cloacimonadota bacterium]|nr:gamma-glutamyl-gamma-aminobutyrate hydrolase family protein [Candidatus Cloacimonadota bacterium]